MSTPELKRGDRVRVAIEGVVDEIYGARKQFTTIAYDTGEVVSLITLVNTAPSTAFELLPPAGWPPRKGDLWRDHVGDLWFAVDDGDVALTCSGYLASDPADVSTTYGPLTLVYREEKPGGEPE